MIIPPDVFSFGVNGNTNNRHPDGVGNSSTTDFIFSGFNGSLVFFASSLYFSSRPRFIFGTSFSEVDNVSFFIILLLLI